METNRVKTFTEDVTTCLCLAGLVFVMIAAGVQSIQTKKLEHLLETQQSEIDALTAQTRNAQSFIDLLMIQRTTNRLK